jgi:hypothetical protein
MLTRAMAVGFGKRLIPLDTDTSDIKECIVFFMNITWDRFLSEKRFNIAVTFGIA